MQNYCQIYETCILYHLTTLHMFANLRHSEPRGEYNLHTALPSFIYVRKHTETEKSPDDVSAPVRQESKQVSPKRKPEKGLFT